VNAPRIGRESPGVKTLLLAAVAAAAVAWPAGAGAATKTIWHDSNLDAAASDVAGFPVTVKFSDNVAEWNLLTGGRDWIGFTYPTAPPGFELYDPYDGDSYSAYHVVWLHPSIEAILQTIEQSGVAAVDPADAGEALMVLDHESQHQRLASLDESRVNACALADMPRFLSADFATPATLQQTLSTQTVTKRVRVRYRKRVDRRLVWRYRVVVRHVQVTTTEAVDNPVYDAVLAAARSFRSSQPPPYNSGTCY
jgi:hypothetical protein